MAAVFAARGKGGAILEGGRVASGRSITRYSWVRTGTGYSAGTHTWRLRVRGVFGPMRACDTLFGGCVVPRSSSCRVHACKRMYTVCGVTLVSSFRPLARAA
jgi:hypothetical protein